VIKLFKCDDQLRITNFYFKALEEKYTNQKAIIMKMEEHALELSKNQQGITSPESDKTGARLYLLD
jgi:hypothetical protein